jgi:hypothetical protein
LRQKEEKRAQELAHKARLNDIAKQEKDALIAEKAANEAKA